MRQLTTLTVKNFKSIQDQTLQLQPLNVMIGGNGSGKSNFIAVFRLLRELVEQNLTGFTLQKGGADNLLHFGRKHSPSMTIEMMFEEPRFGNGYQVVLAGTDDDGLVVQSEDVMFWDKGKYPKPYDQPLSRNTREAAIAKSANTVGRYVRSDLLSYRVYHFHDTSDTAPAKGMCDLEDNLYLRPQAENLSAFLYFLSQREPDCFSLIEATVRQIAPFFDAFKLNPSRLSPNRIRLEWKEKGSDGYFNATALSDGTLRFICLATLLLQPRLPAVVLLDEPELGLHPAAIQLLADLLSSAATRTQVIVATQSVTLVNHFAPDDVWVVDREDGHSVFRHLSSADMSSWLEDYSLGDLWEKNILGGRP